MGDNVDERKGGNQEIGKEWTEIGMKAEGKKNRGNKRTPNNMPELKDRKGYRIEESPMKEIGKGDIGNLRGRT